MGNDLTVGFTRLRNDVEIPAYQTAGAAAFDLASAVDATVAAHSLAILPTGLVIATPPEHVMILSARSSLFKKKGLMLANGIGVIDSDYCGPEDEIGLALFNPGDAPVAITKGERLAQGMILPVRHCAFVERQATGESRGGFGSTG